MLQGIQAARDAGLIPIMVNAVLLRGVNEDEAEELVDWARRGELSLRFIELMPIGGGPARGREYLVPGADVKARIERIHRLVPMDDGDTSSPARTFRFADGPGDVGFINPVTEPFCASCDRIRITADGVLRTCLFAMEETDLRTPLRDGSSDEEIVAVLRRAILGKRMKHAIGEPGFVRTSRSMSQIGG